MFFQKVTPYALIATVTLSSVACGGPIPTNEATGAATAGARMEHVDRNPAGAPAAADPAAVDPASASLEEEPIEMTVKGDEIEVRTEASETLESYYPGADEVLVNTNTSLDAIAIEVLSNSAAIERVQIAHRNDPTGAGSTFLLDVLDNCTAPPCTAGAPSTSFEVVVQGDMRIVNGFIAGEAFRVEGVVDANGDFQRGSASVLPSEAQGLKVQGLLAVMENALPALGYGLKTSSDVPEETRAKSCDIAKTGGKVATTLLAAACCWYTAGLGCFACKAGSVAGKVLLDKYACKE